MPIVGEAFDPGHDRGQRRPIGERGITAAADGGRQGPDSGFHGAGTVADDYSGLGVGCEQEQLSQEPP